jgi:DnaJ family protein B protein 4
VVFPEMGNELFGQKPSDLVFVVKALPHKDFKREGNNLIYTKKISLLQALLSEPISIVIL